MNKKITGAVLMLIACSIFYLPAVNMAEEEKQPSGSATYVLENPNLLKKASIDLRDINVNDAIKYLADKAEVNVAIGKNVNGRVNLSFKNVTVRDAIDIILRSNDLAAEMRGEILYVMLASEYETLHGEKWADPRQVKVFKIQYARPTDILAVLSTLKSKVGSVISDNDSGTVVIMDSPEKLIPMQEAIASMDKESITQVFELKYASAKNIEAALTGRLDAKGIGSIKADEKTNKVVVTTLPARLNEVSRIIAELDKKTRQVLIEAKIVEVTLSPDFDMGIDWQYIVNTAKNKSIDITMQFPVASTVASFGQVVAGVLSQDDYTATLKILKTVGETKILSSPRITAINGQEANIMVGTREAYVTQTVTQGTSTATTSDAVTFLDVGVKLFVTPMINEDGFVTLKIRPEVSHVTDHLTTYNSDGTIRTQVPIVATTNADTAVVVKDGYTIIIGGLIKNEILRTTKKVPGLADIPFIGGAFKQLHEEKEKTELVVFLTPHIVSGDKGMEGWDNKDIKGLRDYK